MSYELIDSGDQKKLERFGPYVLIRPSQAALWKPMYPEYWKEADASFSREEENRWTILKKNFPKFWEMEFFDLKFFLEATPFGHLGIFPEHAHLWEWMLKKIHAAQRKKIEVLNLFAYTGGASLALAKEKVSVCHLDASFPAVEWAKKNALLNGLESFPIRWIVDDAMKFLKREQKRAHFYDGVILDPPSFGRGKKMEVFKIEEHLVELLSLVKGVLTKNPLFVVLSNHTPGITPIILSNVMKQVLPKGDVLASEMVLVSKRSFSLPAGCYAIWEKHV